MMSCSVVGESFVLLSEGLGEVSLEEGDSGGEKEEEGVGSSE